MSYYFWLGYEPQSRAEAREGDYGPLCTLSVFEDDTLVYRKLVRKGQAGTTLAEHYGHDD